VSADLQTLLLPPPMTLSVCCVCGGVQQFREVWCSATKPLLPHPNDVLCLCSCAGDPCDTVDKLFLDKLPGADGMRVVTVDGLICLAAIDFTAAVCACNAHEASTKLSKLSSHEKDGPYVSKLLARKHQFPGERQRAIAVITFSEAVKLLCCYLPRTYTGEMMEYVFTTFTRLMAGDAGLLKELARNAMSEGLAQAAARSERGIDQEANRAALGGPLKRRRVEYDAFEQAARVTKMNLENARASKANAEHEARIVKMNVANANALVRASAAKDKAERQNIIETFNAVRRASGGTLSARDREAYKACMLKLVGLEPEPGPEVVDTARCARRRRGA